VAELYTAFDGVTDTKHEVLLVTPGSATLEVAVHCPAGTTAKSIRVEVDEIVKARLPADVPAIMEAEDADVEINVTPSTVPEAWRFCVDNIVLTSCLVDEAFVAVRLVTVAFVTVRVVSARVVIVAVVTVSVPTTAARMYPPQRFWLSGTGI
jgi:hypothetical protein